MRTKQTIVNEMDCFLSAKSVNEGIARSLLGSFLAQIDPTVEELSDLKCAVSEAVTNAVVHGYRGQREGDANPGPVDRHDPAREGRARMRPGQRMRDRRRRPGAHAAVHDRSGG